MAEPPDPAPLAVLIVRLRSLRFYTDCGPEIPDCVPVTCHLEQVAGKDTLTVGDLRLAAADLEALREEHAVLLGELEAINADPTRSHAVQQLQAQLTVEREENAQLKLAHKHWERLGYATQQIELEGWKVRAEQAELGVRHWRDARQSAVEAADAFQAERDSLKKDIADLNDAISEALKDRDYYEAQETQALSAAEERERIAFEAGMSAKVQREPHDSGAWTFDDGPPTCVIDRAWTCYQWLLTHNGRK